MAGSPAKASTFDGNPWSFEQVKNVDHALLIEAGFDAGDREALQEAMTSLGVRVSWLSDRQELVQVLGSLEDQSGVFSVEKRPRQSFWVGEYYEDSIAGLITRVKWAEGGQLRSFEIHMH